MPHDDPDDTEVGDETEEAENAEKMRAVEMCLNDH